MKIHADLATRAVVQSDNLPWRDSPLAGVQRRMLERDGEEVARATTVVRYEPGSYFDAHTHGGGEEFLVLDGVFSDEMGDFPTGMYVRNPIGSSHKPFSADGAKILVKLQQFHPQDQAFVRINTQTEPWQPGAESGVEIMPLHEFGSETVAMYRLAAGTQLPTKAHTGGEEILVVSGSFSDEYGDYDQGTWLRNPPGSEHTVITKTGCVLFVKAGHLPKTTPTTTKLRK